MSRRIRAEWLEWPETKTLCAAFAAQHARLRFVGGAVRDALLERSVTDLDAATPLIPEEVIELLERAGIRAIPTGLAHGTVTALVGKKHVEITTLRKDTACDGRHAMVEYTDDWQLDAARRDFTMNALYADPDGTLYDYYDGERDAREGRVIFIGDAAARISEDALRILRFFRFHAHYGKGPLDAQAVTACATQRALIANLSGERIQLEMLKLLLADEAPEVLAAMETAGILPYLELPPRQDISTLITVERRAGLTPDALRRLGLLMMGQDTDKLADRWRLSGAQSKRLQALAHPLQNLLADMPEAEQKKAIRMLGEERFIDYVLLAWARDLGHAQQYLAMIALAQHWHAPIFPVSGNDLIRAGLQPGKEIGEVLRRLETHWEELDYRPTKDALLRMVQP